MYSWEHYEREARMKYIKELEQRIDDMTQDMETQKKTIALQSETVDILNEKVANRDKRLRNIHQICADLLTRTDKDHVDVSQDEINMLLCGDPKGPLENFPRAVK